METVETRSNVFVLNLAIIFNEFETIDDDSKNQILTNNCDLERIYTCELLIFILFEFH